MKLLKKVVSNETGQVLPMALVLLVLGGLLVVPTLALMTTNLNANRVVEQKTMEFYSADAGVEMALWHVKYDPAFALPTEGEVVQLDPFTLNNRTVNVSVGKQAGEPYKITSTSTSVDGKSTTIECYIGVSGGGDVWDYALASLGGDITLSGNSEIESDAVLGGDCYANGDVNVSGNAEVDGNATATGDITVSQNGDINGDQTEGAAPLTAPEIDTNSYKNEAYTGCGISCGSYTHSSLTITTNQTYPNRVYVQNDLTIQSNCTVTFNNTVCVGGNLKIEGNTKVTFNGPVRVGGQIKISGNAEVAFNSTVCTIGDLILSSNKNTTFGDTIYVGGNLKVTSNINVNLGGTVYVYGGIEVSGNANFIGGEHIFAETGDIKLSGNSQLDAADIPFIMAITGDVTIAGNNWTSAIVYAPEGQISLTGNCKLYGCAVGESVIGSGNSTVQYLMELRDRDDLPGRGEEGGSGIGLQILNYTIH